jgi:hypothetical protein
MPQATFSSRKVKFRTLLFISKFDTNTVSYFMVLARSEEWQRILSWLHFQTLKQRNATGVTNRAICRVNSSVSPVGSIKHYGFVARNTGARQKWRVCAEKHAVFSLLSEKRAGSPALSELILGRKQGLVRRIGHLKSFRFASKKPGARVRFERARPKHVVCSRTSVLALHHPRFGRKNGLPDRAFQINQMLGRETAVRALISGGRT